MGRRDALPGDLLLHPIALVALVVVIVNDRWLKVHHPGLASGKLSDIAGLIYFPLFVATLIELIRMIVGHRWKSSGRWMATPKLVAGIAIVTGLIFTVAKTTSWGGNAYQIVFGVAWWPVDAAASLYAGGGLPPVGRLGLTRDATDLIALPCLVIPVVIARKVSEARSAPDT